MKVEGFAFYFWIKQSDGLLKSNAKGDNIHSDNNEDRVITVITMVPMMLTMVVTMITLMTTMVIFCQLVYIGCDISYSI